MEKHIPYKKFAVTGFFICLFVLFLVLFLSQYFYGPGMVAPFENVRGLTRDISLLTTVDGSNIILTNLKQGKDLSSDCIYHYQYSQTSDDFYDFGPAIAVTPDNSRFYICQENTIDEYNSTGQLMRNLQLPEFDLKPYQYRRLEKAEASNDTLWLSLLFDCNDECKDVIVEWPIVDEAAIPKILPIDPYKDVDPFGQLCMTFKNGWGVETLDAKEVIGKAWPQANVDEVIAGDSLIADDVSFVDLPTKTKQNITDGSQAQWGSDGYIYFIRKGTQLWRIKPGAEQEAVYKATGFARGGRTMYGHELVFNADRSCLAFCYRVPIHEIFRNEDSLRSQLYGTVRCCCVIIDLKTNEYMHIPAERFYDIYQDLDSNGTLNLSDEIIWPLKRNRHIWHIENMALVVRSENLSAGEENGRDK